MINADIVFVFLCDWCLILFFFSSRRRHTRYWRDWSSEVCSSDLTFIAEPCGDCGGAGSTRKLHTLSIKIPPGVDNGSRLKLRNEGEVGAAGGQPGDRYVVIQVAPHPLFVREGLDIICDVPISFVQATLGSEIDVPTLEGKVKMKIPSGTESG